MVNSSEISVMALEQGPQQSMEQFKGQARLPKFAVPRRYDLSFKPDLSACTFTGAVQITVDVIDSTHFLVLNSAELAVRDGSISFKSHYFDKELRPSEIVLVEGDEILVLKFDEVLPIGTGVLAIGFEGTLNDRMKGFYRSVYVHNGEKKNMAVTQFEPADARRCFPCWDEPACKATFKMTLEVPSELVALSNMPVIDEKVNGSLKTVSFQESPIMSTYLVAIVIGLFDYVEGSTTDGVKVRVYCQVGKSNQGKFALDVAVKTLLFYKKYFNEPYALPKLDMVAIPDFAAGAMENYGLVTYRETDLLYDEHLSAAANKQQVATTVAHELAHQWFGNLVTMEWWTHLWLNEGFATWMSYQSADSLFPEWNIWTQFLDETTGGLTLDALADSHPIEVDINHANEINEIFDDISYRKGASVIRMLQSYLGADVFQKSLALYIKRFAWSNAKTEDLWAALEEVSGKPVNLIMNSWTKQKGYPVVSVKVNGDNLEFEQSQFLSSGLPGDGQWMVPISVCFGSYDAQKKFLLKTKTEKLDKLDFSDSSDTSPNLVEQGSQRKVTQTWVKVNFDQTGFYRVQYDDQLTAGLRSAVEAKQLSETDRYGILDDSFALCMACKQTTSSLISLMSAYREELNYTVVSQIISMSYKLADMIAEATPELLNETKLFLRNLLQFSAGKLGWDPKEGESHLDAMLRGELLTALAKLGHESTLHEAMRRFTVFLDDRNTQLLPPDIRTAAYIAVMQTVTATNRSGYNSLLRVFTETDLSQEKVRILGCLSSCPDAAVVHDVLNFLLTPAVRSQDVVYGLAGISREGREIAWIWLKENWDFISKTWDSGLLLTIFVSSIVSPFSSDEKAKEIEAFFATRIQPSISRTLKQSLERVGNNARWIHYIKNDKELGEAVRELAYKKY